MGKHYLEPLFVIIFKINIRMKDKKLKKIGSDTDLSISGYGDTDLSTQSTIFRITARGTGGRDTTQTLLRSHYAKSF